MGALSAVFVSENRGPLQVHEGLHRALLRHQIHLLDPEGQVGRYRPDHPAQAAGLLQLLQDDLHSGRLLHRRVRNPLFPPLFEFRMGMVIVCFFSILIVGEE